MLAANALILQHGAGAEEYAAKQWWDARRRNDETGASQWLSMLDALKRTRELRAKILHDS